LGNVPEDDMRRTFNLGIGLIMVVSRKRAPDILKLLKKKRETGFVVGEVVRSRKGKG
jgi:phosphoribosylformylglycinamidine cyclo-ligase